MEEEGGEVVASHVVTFLVLHTGELSDCESHSLCRLGVMNKGLATVDDMSERSVMLLSAVSVSCSEFGL